MGTVLQRKGLKLGKAPVLLNIEEPELITSIHKEYMAAGCDFVTTNTFSVNRHKVAGLPYTVAELVSAGVRVAKEAVRGTDVYKRQPFAMAMPAPTIADQTMCPPRASMARRTVTSIMVLSP